MPMATTAVETFALWVSPSGTFRLLPWDAAITPDDALCCNIARPVDLTTQLIMWVDDDALLLDQPLNGPACALLSTYEALPGPYFGDVVFTGSTDAQGNILGLTQDQALMLVDRYLQRPALLPRPRHTT
ncbi:DUF3846 domain-containing protein [Streptomyces sp. H39-C1]|uniref:DUF3846 domain-containing protein n=1 Tax=Streptomyces sp. H39-C1 TaxID=3004355 RepID=UPI0022AEF827|nr:DUF3846 domain-containing protein [Streptomyces sp. H39-C1]MCZ4098099.1 DUF3846 domain-containing protein [Streptomyces sp. H39-C1]